MTRKDLSHNVLEVEHTDGTERWLVIKTMLKPRKVTPQGNTIPLHLFFCEILLLRLSSIFLFKMQIKPFYGNSSHPRNELWLCREVWKKIHTQTDCANPERLRRLFNPWIALSSPLPLLIPTGCSLLPAVSLRKKYESHILGLSSNICRPGVHLSCSEVYICNLSELKPLLCYHCLL